MAECMVQRHQFTELPSPDEQDAVRDWMCQHGINPSDVPVPGWIEVRPAVGQIAYEAIVFDADGVPRLDGEGRDLLTEERVVQLDRAPLPFPAVDA